jgi:hypothetical protein
MKRSFGATRVFLNVNNINSGLKKRCFDVLDRFHLTEDMDNLEIS